MDMPPKQVRPGAWNRHPGWLLFSNALKCNHKLHSLQWAIKPGLRLDFSVTAAKETHSAAASLTSVMQEETRLKLM